MSQKLSPENDLPIKEAFDVDLSNDSTFPEGGLNAWMTVLGV